MLLLLADGMTITAAAALVGLSRWHSYKWIRRFLQDGVAGLARRGRMLLLLADGMTITAAATLVGLSRWHSYKWIRRFLQDGVAGLADKPHPRRRLRPVPYALRESPTRDVG